MRKTVLTFGLISGAVMSAMLVITIPFQDAIERAHAGLFVGYASMVAASLLIYFGVRRYRDTVAGGRVSFGRGFVVGLLIALLGGACYTATWEVMYFGFDSDYIAKYQAHEMEQAKARGATTAEIEQKKMELAKFAKMYANPIFNTAMTFLEPLPVGLLMALISASLLRTRSKREAAGGLISTA